MKTLTAYRTNQPVYNILLMLVTFTFIIVWLPFIRGIFDGESYQWGTTLFGISFSSAGISSDFILLIFEMIFYGFLFMSFYWMRNRMMFYALLIFWFLIVFGNLLFDLMVSGDSMFHGDTLNVHVSLSSIIIPLSILAAILIFIVIRKDLKLNGANISWSVKNKRLFYIIFGPLPIQAVLFYIGEPHGFTDQIGVVISLTQAFLIPLIVKPYNSSVSK